MKNDQFPFSKSESFKAGIAQKARARREAGGVRLEETERPPPRNDLTPAVVIEVRCVNDLKSPARRLRKTLREHVEELKDSVAQFGLCGFPLITDEGEIIDGEVLIEACRGLGITEIPCQVIRHLSKHDIRRLRITRNRTQEKGAWDIDVTGLEISDLRAEGGPICPSSDNLRLKAA